MKKYLIVIEETSTGYSAYSPDLDGCVSTGRTREEVEKNMQEAIAFHLDGLPRSASVRAVESTLVLKIDRESFRELIQERPLTPAKSRGRPRASRL